MITSSEPPKVTSNTAPRAAYGTMTISATPATYTSAATSTTEKPTKEFAPTATAVAIEERYESMKAFVSELVNGKEPAYTESVMSRLSSLMYRTEAPIVAKATSAIGEAYDSFSSMVSENYGSASSAIRDATEKAKEAYSAVRDEL